MKRKILKVGALVMALSMLFSVNVFASEMGNEAEEQAQVWSSNRAVSDSLSFVYNDMYGSRRVLEFDCYCNYSADWDDSSYGVINSAVFEVYNAYINGEYCVMYEDGGPYPNYPGWSQDYNPNNSGSLIRVNIFCNEWGDGFLGAERV